MWLPILSIFLSLKKLIVKIHFPYPFLLIVTFKVLFDISFQASFFLVQKRFLSNDIYQLPLHSSDFKENELNSSERSFLPLQRLYIALLITQEAKLGCLLYPCPLLFYYCSLIVLLKRLTLQSASDGMSGNIVFFCYLYLF